jgi:hypothetical protein
MDWCDVCKYNPPDYSSHEPDKPCGDCWVYGEGNEPSKFIETENRQTNADRIRSMTDEEMAEFLYGGCCREGETFPCPDVGCKKCWLDWLKEEAKE